METKIRRASEAKQTDDFWHEFGSSRRTTVVHFACRQLTARVYPRRAPHGRKCPDIGESWAQTTSHFRWRRWREPGARVVGNVPCGTKETTEMVLEKIVELQRFRKNIRATLRTGCTLLRGSLTPSKSPQLVLLGEIQLPYSAIHSGPDVSERTMYIKNNVYRSLPSPKDSIWRDGFFR